jgi:hypothetical protein
VAFFSDQPVLTPIALPAPITPYSVTD